MYKIQLDTTWNRKSAVQRSVDHSWSDVPCLKMCETRSVKHHSISVWISHGNLFSQDGTKVAETSLKVTSPFRLGLVRHRAEGSQKRETTWNNVKQRETTFKELDASYHARSTSWSSYISHHILYILPPRNKILPVSGLKNRSKMIQMNSKCTKRARAQRQDILPNALKSWQTWQTWQTCISIMHLFCRVWTCLWMRLWIMLCFITRPEAIRTWRPLISIDINW